MHCLTAWGQWAVELLQCTASLLGGSGQWNPCNTLPHCMGAVGSGNPAAHCHTAWGQWAVGLSQRTASLPGASGQCNSCNALSYRLGAVGRGLCCVVLCCAVLCCVVLCCVVLCCVVLCCVVLCCVVLCCVVLCCVVLCCVVLCCVVLCCGVLCGVVLCCVVLCCVVFFYYLLVCSEAFVGNSEMPITSELIQNSSAAMALSVTGIAHQSFSDTPIMFPSFLARKLRMCGTLDVDTAYDAILFAIDSFLEHTRSPAAPIEQLERVVLSKNPFLQRMACAGTAR